MCVCRDREEREREGDDCPPCDVRSPFAQTVVVHRGANNRIYIYIIYKSATANVAFDVGTRE